MRLVNHIPAVPARCAITGQPLSEKDGPFLDTGKVLPLIRPRVVLSQQGALEVGKAIGLLDPAELEALKAENDELRARLAVLEDDAQDAAALRANVEYTLTQFGQTIHKKPGPKPKATV